MMTEADLADARAKTTCGNPDCDTCRLAHRMFDHIDAQAARVAALVAAGNGLHHLVDQIVYRLAQGERLAQSANDIDAAVEAWRVARRAAADGE